MLKPQANAHRECLSFDGFWEFRPQHDGEDADWSNGFDPRFRLAVPGSWNEQIHELRFFFGRGWYQRRVHLPHSFLAAGRRIFLHVGAVSQNAEVWVNGQAVGRHRGGHLPCEFDITEALAGDSSALVVIMVDQVLSDDNLPAGTARRAEDRLGFKKSAPDVPYDFFPFGGIHRPVSISSRAERHLERIRVDTDLDGDAGRITVRAQA
ncbi:MAG: sugar-binding domain-containing protein, partial [Planctomycetota bacterium]